MPPSTRLLVWLESSAPHLTPTSEQCARWAARCAPTIFRCALSQDEFLDELPHADAAAVWRFEQDWFARAPRLRRLATPAAGRDYFRVTPPEQVELTYGTFHGPLMAETVAGMMLAACRGVLASAVGMSRETPWPRATLGAGCRTLSGSRVTVVGFGSIGQWIGRMLKPFGVRLTGVNRRTLTRPDYFDANDTVRPLPALDETLPETDHLVLCVPSGPDSDGLMDAARWARLPRGAGVYNVGRGNSVDEASLAAALRTGQVGWACLDVFAREPLTSASPLWGCPGFYPMPHISALSPDYLDRFFDEFWRSCETA